MNIVMGATGNVGSAVAAALLEQGQPVTIVTRHAGDPQGWRARGAEIAIADAGDADSLRAAFRRGERAFLLNPPADPATDSDAVELRTVDSILTALDGSGLLKVVAESTYGAQPGERIGDLGTLWALEQGLRDQPIPAAINRGAYHLSNWDGSLERAASTGTLHSMLPADLAIPMVAPADLGRAAARRLISPIDDIGIVHVEGSARYSSADVADVLGRLVGREVHIDVTDPADWEQSFRASGFSPAAAESYARMTRLTVDDGFDPPDDVERGTTSLEDYFGSQQAVGL